METVVNFVNRASYLSNDILFITIGYTKTHWVFNYIRLDLQNSPPFLEKEKIPNIFKTNFEEFRRFSSNTTIKKLSFYVIFHPNIYKTGSLYTQAGLLNLGTHH